MIRARNTHRLEKLDAITFDALLEQQDPFGVPGARFNLREVRFVTPAGMVQLAAACYVLAREGRRPVITLGGVDVPRYLLRANFVNVMRSVARFDPEIKQAYLHRYDDLHGSNRLLIEVTRIETGSALPALLDRVVDALREELCYPAEDAYDVGIAVSEIGQNAFQHNGQACGFFAMQVYGQGARRFLEVGLADCGDGLSATLRRNPKNPPIRSDLDAIAYATRLGTSE